MSFSGAVKLSNLDDFLAPSAACVKPLVKAKDSKVTSGGGVKIAFEHDYPEGFLSQFNHILS